MIKVARSENIDCPGTIGVSGFGNLPDTANYCAIPTVDQHPWHLGVQAVKCLLDVVENKNSGEIFQVEIPTEIINAELI
jgi:DNA-binding LacI/PurR family transcriptional regulator